MLSPFGARRVGVPKASLHPPLRSGRNRDEKCFPWNIRSPFSLRAFHCFDHYAMAAFFADFRRDDEHSPSMQNEEWGEYMMDVTRRESGTRIRKQDVVFLTAKLGSSRETAKSENHSSSNMLAIYKRLKMEIYGKPHKFS